ncbi:hydrogenase [Brumimicrobium glaciale]|uniref:Hydrogenase n=2 Tax=Brumimicrobium glaciale TaxID=200475 RepID=A0A4Q4KLH1_9FLAO|nr:hydrogenase [Brumimicrobium glaciale]
MHKEATIREPLVLGHKTYHQVTEDVCKPIEGKAPKTWYILFAIAAIIGVYGIGCILYLLGTGIGTWGLNKTINWAWDITNFVWWVGIGHAGTLISAVLLLFRQKWRMAINRSAEAMTIFAVFMAGIFPLIHMGRIWVAYWVMPLPNQFGSLWPNFNSPLLWDVFAISTYLSVSLVFWYIGLIPDFSTIRDRAKKPVAKKIYSMLSFGWSGRAKQWSRFETVSLVLAGLATPLVFSVHSIVSFDFATSVIPGWHTTIFPPYFVAGAVFSGFAMVQTLMLVMRKAYNLEAYIHTKHIEYMNIVIMATGSIVGTAYITELFISWYSGVEYESYAFFNRATGPYWWAYATMMTCNVLSPQLMWFKKLRTSLSFTFVIAIVVNIGMWFERFVIITTSLHRDYLPSSWSMFYPTHIDIGIFVGTIGLFFVFFLLFTRYFPVLALNEVKTILKSSGQSYKDGTAKTPAFSIEEQHLADVKVKPSITNETIVSSVQEETKTAPVQKAVDPITDPVIDPALAKIVTSLGSTDATKKDDLKELTGLDAALEDKLNKIGILTFSQIANINPTADLGLLTAYLGNAGSQANLLAWKLEAEEKLKNDNN